MSYAKLVEEVACVSLRVGSSEPSKGERNAESIPALSASELDFLLPVPGIEPRASHVRQALYH